LNFSPRVLLLFHFTPLANVHNFLIYALSYSVF